MIKISEKLWYVIKPEDKDALAYMCPYGETTEGDPLANIAKMQSTGRSWARVGAHSVYKLKGGASSYDYELDEQGRLIVDYVSPAKEGEEFIVENTPTSGFYVGCSVSRWSTSNKLFRVKDPRGFTVEIPTDNLATLLHHTTVVKGVVQEACCWGREGNNHILLPINSEPYLITLDQMDTLENKLINLKDLKVGDTVKMFEDPIEYYYAGKIKGTWRIRGYTTTHSYSYSGTGSTKYGEWIEVKDDKWTDVFLRKIGYETSDGSKYTISTFSKPKIVEVIKHEPLDLKVEDYSWYCPQRVTNKTQVYDYWRGSEKELIDVEYKK